VKPSPLHHDASWISLGHSSYLGCQWLLVYAFAKLGGPDAVGVYALGLAISAPVIMLANMHLRELHASDAGGEYLLRERSALRLAGLGAGLVGIATLCSLMPWSIAVIGVVLAVAGAKAIESMSELGYGAMQAQRRFRSLAAAQVLRGVVGLAFGVTSFALTQQVLPAVLGVVCGWLLTFCLNDILALRRILGVSDGLFPRCSGKRFWALFRQAAPMGIAGGLNTITLMSPHYAIQFHHDSTHLGLYVTLGYLLLPINILVLALGQAAVPRFAAAYQRGDGATILRLVSKVAAVAVVVGLGSILLSAVVGSQILLVVYGTAWGDLRPVLVLLAIAGLLQWLATVFGFAVTAMRQLTHQLSIALITCSVSLVGSFALVPTHGLTGAAWSMIITSATLVSGYLVLFARSYRRLRAVAP
jgi:O-antigen/teichoic acid export membrane protein